MDLRAAIGKREWKKSLGTRSKCKAQVLSAQLYDETEAQIQISRDNAFVDPSCSDPLDCKDRSNSVFLNVRSKLRRDVRLAVDRSASRLEKRLFNPATIDGVCERLEYKAQRLAALSPYGQEIRSNVSSLVEGIVGEIGLSPQLDDQQMLDLCQDYLAYKRRENEEIRRLYAGGARTPNFALSEPTVASLLREYYAARSPRWAQKTKTKFATVSRILNDVLGENTELNNITRATLKNARELINCLPPNYAKRKELKGLNIEQAVAKAKLMELPKIGRKTAGDYLSYIVAIFEFAEKEELISRSPARGLENTSTNVRPKRLPFSENDLERLFGAPVYSGCEDDEKNWRNAGRKHPKRSKYWIPLIALHTGLRLNEICGLRVQDVFKHSDGYWVIDICDHDFRALKNESSVRQVPVHQGLIELSFDKWVSGQSRREPHAQLFADLKPNKAGLLSDPFSKWFTRFRKHAGVSGAQTQFHSFRHYFEDRLREAEVAMELNERLMGWSSTRMQSRYGRGPSLGKLNQAIQSVSISVQAIEGLKRASF